SVARPGVVSVEPGQSGAGGPTAGRRNAGESDRRCGGGSRCAAFPGSRRSPSGARHGAPANPALVYTFGNHIGRERRHAQRAACLRRGHPCRAVRRSHRQVCRSRVPAPPCRSAAVPRADPPGRDTVWMGTQNPRAGTQDDQAAARIADMDDEGTDAHFLIPTAWTSLVGHEDPTLETGVIRAYHRHMEDFCAQYPGRLTSMIVASARDPEAAVKEIREWGKSRWAVAVMPLVTRDIPADHPSLDPI